MTCFHLFVAPSLCHPDLHMNSIRALLNRIIDYAGLFPPAKLDMASTVQNYARYVHSAEAWMLGRLIVPVARLPEFEQYAPDLLPHDDEDDGDPWQISALAGVAENDADLERDLRLIDEFNQRHQDRRNGLAMIDMVELKADLPTGVDRALDRVPDHLFPFFEISIDQDPRGLIAALVDGDAGAKVRTGGTAADLYPSVDHLARFMSACGAANVPFKATAGLHHPLRHRLKESQVHEHGFLNVFIAGALAMIHRLGEPDLGRVLREESIEAFRFRDDEIAWRDLRLTTADIDDVREEFAVSFGSCSFDEPLGDLRAMKLL